MKESAFLISSNSKRLVINLLVRSKKSILLLLLIVCTFILIQSLTNKSVPTSRPNENEKKFRNFNLIRNRNNFHNPVYKQWISDDKYEKIQSLELSKKCESYFHELHDPSEKVPGPDFVDLERIKNFEYDHLLYKQKKWFREKTKETKRRLNRQGQKMNKAYEEQLNDVWIKSLQELSDYEHQAVREINHARVFGKCYIERNIKNDEDESCSLNERKIYPWLHKELPNFQNWKGQTLPIGQVPIFNQSKLDQYSENELNSPCFMKKIKNLSNGKGIIITIFPSSGTKRLNQIENISRLIKVLRGLKNKLPIEIMYMNQDLSNAEKNILIEASRTEVSGLPDSFNDYFNILKIKEPDFHDAEFHFQTSLHYPKQELWFVDMTSLKNKQGHPLVAKSYKFNSPTFIQMLSTVFNSFEEFVALSQHAIPLIENFGDYLFEMESYKEYGLKLFKNPSHYQLRARRFEPGFHEITNLVKHYMMPNKYDQKVFGMNQRSKKILFDTNRILEEYFNSLIDPTIMVFNKLKVMNGLLLSCNLQLYSILSSRFHTPKGELNSEFVWLGQEISGTNIKLNFNRHYGVAAGVMTPPQNKPTDLVTLSGELCSSSWAQLDDRDDFTMIYITSHQLQNWLYEGLSFQSAIEEKFTVYETKFIDNIFTNNENATKTSVKVADRELYDDTFGKNPLYIDTAMNPSVIKEPAVIEDATEPNQAWLQIEEFASYKGYPYWCSYDVVGSARLNLRGKLIHYNEMLKARYRFILDVWFR